LWRADGLPDNALLMTKTEPYLIEVPRIGSTDVGFISVAELERVIPFEVRRVFWTYDTPVHQTRGRHAHKVTEQVLWAMSGTITVTTEDALGTSMEFVLNTPTAGLYLPPHVWHVMTYSEGAVQLAFASTLYQKEDYFREKADFLAYWATR
jgi:WxcM-like, C-terminal